MSRFRVSSGQPWETAILARASSDAATNLPSRSSRDRTDLISTQHPHARRPAGIVFALSHPFYALLTATPWETAVLERVSSAAATSHQTPSSRDRTDLISTRHPHTRTPTELVLALSHPRFTLSTTIPWETMILARASSEGTTSHQRILTRRNEMHTDLLPSVSRRNSWRSYKCMSIDYGMY